MPAMFGGEVTLTLNQDGTYEVLGFSGNPETGEWSATEEGAFADDFTSLGNLDALGSTLVGLEFWHLITFPTLVYI